jgi:hypothetical protein
VILGGFTWAESFSLSRDAQGSQRRAAESAKQGDGLYLQVYATEFISTVHFQ